MLSRLQVLLKYYLNLTTLFKYHMKIINENAERLTGGLAQEGAQFWRAFVRLNKGSLLGEL